MQDSSAFQFLAIDTIHESATNPRRTFDEAKLYELAESIKHNGMIQPITVRPNNEGFEIVTGARRFRAAQLAELFSVPARIVEIDDAQALEWQLVENSQRVDVHPYEEAQGFQRLLNLPGYDVAALVEKSGKSASHIYARLSLLQLIPAVAEAFTQERINASHANLISRLPQDVQAKAFEQCWRKDWQDAEPHLLPAKHLSAWIQANLYLSLADAPFDREDATLNSAAGACANCPRRSGYNTSLFCDVQGDQCLDSPCYWSKVKAHIEREIASRPGLAMIETAWRSAKEQQPGILPRGEYREIEAAVENPDAEPDPPCAAAKTAIVVYGKRVGTITTVCTDMNCPVHDPHPATRTATSAAPTVAAAVEVQTETKTEEESAESQQEAERFAQKIEQEQERENEERRKEFVRQQEEHEAERARITALHQARVATLERMIANAPVTFSAAQLRVFLSALVNLNLYCSEDVAAAIVGDHKNNRQTAEEVLATTVAGLPDDKLTGFAVRLVFTDYTAIPREGEIDFLAEAEALFILQQSKKASKPKKSKAALAEHSLDKNRAKKTVAA